MKIPLSRGLFTAAMLLTPLVTLTSQQSGQSQRIPQFENEDVKVWKSTIVPNAPLEMHTHDHARVIVALSGGTMHVVHETGAPDVHVWETGKAYWLSAEQGKQRHADVNAGTKPIEVMVIEIENTK